MGFLSVADLRHFLELGMTLRDAARASGLSYEQAREELTSITDDSDLDTQRAALAASAQHAHEVLRDLMQSDDEKIRLTAATTILQLQTRHRTRKQQLSVQGQQADIWSLAVERLRAESKSG